MENKSNGIIGGGNLYQLNFSPSLEFKKIQTSYGEVSYYLFNDCPLILRHGVPKNKPPHQINYRANIMAFKDLGVKNIFSFNSVGSCRKSIRPGTFLIPDDYIGFETVTFYDQECKYVTPEISLKLRDILINVLKELGYDFRKKGIYFQTRGPRFETKAEIKLIKKSADVVGMTMAQEATLAKELNLEYASLCSIDNYANGVLKIPLTQDSVEKYEKQIKGKTEKILEKISNQSL